MKRIFLLTFVIVLIASQIFGAVDTTRFKVGTNVSIRGNWFEANLRTLSSPKYVVLQMDDSLLLSYKLLCGFRYSNIGDTNKIFFSYPYNPFANAVWYKSGTDSDSARLHPLVVDLAKDSANWNAYVTKFAPTGTALSGRTFVYEVPPGAHRFVIMPLVLDTMQQYSKARMNVYKFKW